MPIIKTTNNRQKRRLQRDCAAEAAAVTFTKTYAVSKKVAVRRAIDGQLDHEGHQPPYRRAGTMAGQYQKSAITLSLFLVGVADLLSSVSPYGFDPALLDPGSCLALVLRELEAQIVRITEPR